MHIRFEMETVHTRFGHGVEEVEQLKKRKNCIRRVLWVRLITALATFSCMPLEQTVPQSMASAVAALFLFPLVRCLDLPDMLWSPAVVDIDLI